MERKKEERKDGGKLEKGGTEYSEHSGSAAYLEDQQLNMRSNEEVTQGYWAQQEKAEGVNPPKIHNLQNWVCFLIREGKMGSKKRGLEIIDNHTKWYHKDCLENAKSNKTSILQDT